MAPPREPVAPEPIAPEPEQVDAVAVAAPVPAPAGGAVERSPVADPAGLCFGAPVHEAGRTLVPVARVRADPVSGELDATPVGVFDVGGAGVRFRAIPDRGAAARVILRTAVAAFAAGAGATLGAGALRRRQRAAPLSPRRLRRR